MNCRSQRTTVIEVKFKSLNSYTSVQPSRLNIFFKIVARTLANEIKITSPFFSLLTLRLEKIPEVHRKCLMLLILSIYLDLALVQLRCSTQTSVKHLWYLKAVFFFFFNTAKRDCHIPKVTLPLARTNSMDFHFPWEPVCQGAALHGWEGEPRVKGDSRAGRAASPPKGTQGPSPRLLREVSRASPGPEVS